MELSELEQLIEGEIIEDVLDKKPLNNLEKYSEINLRPKYLDEYIGQNKVKENMRIYIESAKKRNAVLDHVLLYGPPGLGKTTLSSIIAHEMAANIKVTSGPAIEKAGDLAAILTNLAEGDILFIDEIHRIPKQVEEILYPALEDYLLDIIIGKGPTARSIRVDLPKFTLIGATTRAGLLSTPLRDRFGIIHRLEMYSKEELKQIVLRSAKTLELEIDEEAALEIARRSRGTPRIANRLLKRVMDFATVMTDGKITKEISEIALEKLEVDKNGLNAVDRRILEAIIYNFKGGPVGLDTLSAILGDERDTIEDVYEPFLLQEGYIFRTPKGRIVTDKSYMYLGINKEDVNKN